MMQKRLFFAVLLVVGLQLVVSAQDTSAVNFYRQNASVKVGFRATGFANIMSWQTNEYIDSRYQIQPYLSGSFTVFFQEPIANRLTLEAGVTYIQLGLASSIATNYRAGQRFTSHRTGRSKYTMLAFPICVQYDLTSRSESRTYVFLGANVYLNDADNDGKFARITSTDVDRDVGDTLTTSELQRPVSRFSTALLAGLGWEKHFSKRSSVSLRAVACIGLKPIIQTFLTVTVLNRDRYYSSYSSTNELVNRGTYAGFELCYLFSFR